MDREIRSRERDNRSHNGSSNGHSPVLNLSKSNAEHGSIAEQSDHSEPHSPAISTRDDRDEENLSDTNATDIDERNEKDEGRLYSLYIFNKRRYLYDACTLY